MNNDLVNFMDNKNNAKRDTEFETKSDNSKSGAFIYNVRDNGDGVYFDVKIGGDNRSVVTNLFIPAKYFCQEIEVYARKKNLIIISKSKLVEYILVYPGAVISLILIVLTFLKYLPIIREFFNVSGL
jgi:hypothetical protein